MKYRQDIIILRHKLTEGLSHGESSEALRSMQDEMQRLQVQVTGLAGFGERVYESPIF